MDVGDGKQEARVAALRRSGVLDTAPEPEFDDVVAVASELCHAPVALVSLLDRDRQWFKARIGVELSETPIGQAVCAYALKQVEPLIIPDLLDDPRTKDNPLVTGEPGLRFYAGAPVRLKSGVAIGTVCVLDTVPRPGGLSQGQVRGLEALARQVARLLATREQAIEWFRLVRDSDIRAQLATEAGGVGTFELEVATESMAVSAEFCRVFGVPVQPLYAAETFQTLTIPGDRAGASDAQSRGNGTAQLDVTYRIRRADDGRLRWVARRAQFTRGPDGKATHMFGTVQDVTESRLASLRVSALVELGDELREISTGTEAVAAAAGLLGRTLAVSRAGFAPLDAGAGLFTTTTAWTAPDAPDVGGGQEAGLFAETLARLHRGETVVAADVTVAFWLGDDRAGYARLGVRACLDVPLMEDGKLVAVLFLHDTAPRHWSHEELDFVHGIADRTYASIAKLRAEAEQAMLNDELGHRLKNTMAMVQAIAQQTLRSVPDRGPVLAFEQRLHALSTAHDVLLQRSWAAADIVDVVESAVRTSGQDGRFDLSGPSLQIGARSALALSLLIHELATNAVKYGSLSNSSGRVQLAWMVDGSGAASDLVVRWVERGGPSPNEEIGRGFGSKLILAGLLGTGGVVSRYSEEGVEIEMRARVENVRRS